ncbi:MAG TPA: hypothetical protein EYN06_05800 [Myxococcales bacterium]|nr:hypothetical protein [Myxococcales bacterium]
MSNIATKTTLLSLSILALACGTESAENASFQPGNNGACAQSSDCPPGSKCVLDPLAQSPTGLICQMQEVTPAADAFNASGEIIDTSAPAEPCDGLSCSGTTPYCSNGKCVGCTENAHCTDSGSQCNAANECSSDPTPKCPETKPQWNPQLEQCCQCQEDSDCGAQICDGCSCKEKATGFCASCVGSYPGCIEIEGQWLCVQCSNDSHCPEGSCNTTNYTCKGSGLGDVSPTTGNCKTTSCEVTGTLCDQASGLCYSPGGACDNLTVYCLGGMPCVDILGKTGDLKATLQSDTLLPGKCGCELQGQPFWSKANCPSGLKCGPHMKCWVEILKVDIPDHYCDPHDLNSLFGLLASCPEE